MVSTKERKPFTTIFGLQQDCMIVSYCPKRNKIVNLFEHPAFWAQSRHFQWTKKAGVYPNVQWDEGRIWHNGSNDQNLQLQTENTKVNSCSVLQHVGYIGYKCLRHLEGTQSKLKFQQVTQEKTLSPPIRKGTSRSKWRGIPKEQTRETASEPPRKKARCTVCPSAKDIKTKTACSKCFKNVCQEHSNVMCIRCQQN